LQKNYKKWKPKKSQYNFFATPLLSHFRFTVGHYTVLFKICSVPAPLQHLKLLCYNLTTGNYLFATTDFENITAIIKGIAIKHKLVSIGYPLLAYQSSR
jgi:hypothetical protein